MVSAGQFPCHLAVGVHRPDEGHQSLVEFLTPSPRVPQFFCPCRPAGVKQLPNHRALPASLIAHLTRRVVIGPTAAIINQLGYRRARRIPGRSGNRAPAAFHDVDHGKSVLDCPGGGSAPKRRAAFQFERWVFRPELSFADAGGIRPPCSLFRKGGSGVSPAIENGNWTAPARAPESRASVSRAPAAMRELEHALVGR
jgi:hypothetical protein